MFNSQIIEKFKNLPTPFYYYDLGVLEENLKVLKEISAAPGYHIHYALKANAEERILRLISSYGFGADCVSGNEVKKALETGFAADDVVFAGVGKTDNEILSALQHNILSLNCESIQELEVIHQLALGAGKIAPVALRLKPDLDANTHRYITTGTEENKFGIGLEELEEALERINRMSHLKLTGMHLHIGSQITDFKVFENLAVTVNELQRWFADRGVKIVHLNLGGGLGVDYENPDKNLIPDYKTYFNIFKRKLILFPGQIVHFELGRSIVAQCGSLISRVLYIKKGARNHFAILDAGMTELIRPALYNAYHKIENLTADGPRKKYDVVGPVCESADFFGKGVKLPETRRGDLIAIRSAGAYAAVMASRYNMRDPAGVVFSDTI